MQNQCRDAPVLVHFPTFALFVNFVVNQSQGLALRQRMIDQRQGLSQSH